MDKFPYTAAAGTKQVLHRGEQFADAASPEAAARIRDAMNALEAASVVIPRAPGKRLADAEDILCELAGVFQGRAKLYASKGTPEGDHKAKREGQFALLIQDFLAQGGCSHDHQVPFLKDNGISALLCLGCGQTRMEFYVGLNPQLSKENAEATCRL